MYYYETGEIKEKGNFKYDKKEGIWQSYFKNGNIKIETSYYLDKQTNGIWKKFYETGELMCECPVVDNKFFGDYKQYNKYNVLVYKCFMRNNMKNGDEIYYDRQGKEIIKRKYVNNREIKS